MFDSLLKSLLKSISNGRHYFDGIEKNLHCVIEKYGQGWSMRLYYQMSKISSNQMETLCNLSCMYPENFEMCNIENIPHFGKFLFFSDHVEM